MKLTNTLTTFMLLASLCFSSFVSAEDQVVVPVVTKPAVLQEGTQRVLSVEQIAELIPWAKNSKVFLNDLLNTIAGLSSTDKLDRLEDGIKSIVGESAPKNSELLMRYILNRGLVINDLLKTEMNADEVGTIDTKLRVLVLSIKMAITYYDIDMENLNKKTDAPFIAFGTQYFNFLTELNKSVFDASASYNIQRTAFEWLQWDLYRDLNNQQLAPQIVKINNSLKIYPLKRMSDSQYISYIRQMKLMAEQLSLKDSLKSENGKPIYSANDYISVCSSVFSDNWYKNACISKAKSDGLDIDLIKVCGTIHKEDSKTYECVNNRISSQVASLDLIASYKACGSIFSDSWYVNECLSIVNKSGLQAEEINSCGKHLRSDSPKYECIKTISNK